MPKEMRTRANSHVPFLPWKARYSSAATSTSGNQLKEWREVLCPACLEPPHNAVLLLCSSRDKGCRPFMCDTSYRYSNCLNQYRKNSSGLRTTQTDDIQDQPSITILSCPHCRGTVTGWIIDKDARNYMNTLSRSCSSESCGYVGDYGELRRHARKEHPSVRPSEPDPERQEAWRRVEEEEGRADAIIMLQSEHGFEALMDMLHSETIDERFIILQSVQRVLEDRIWEAQVWGIVRMLLLDRYGQFTVFVIFDNDDRLDISEESSINVETYPELDLIRISSRGSRGRRNATIILVDSFTEELSTQRALSALANIERNYDDEAYLNSEQSYNRDEDHSNLGQHPVCQDSLGLRHLGRNAARDNGVRLIEMDEGHDNVKCGYNGEEAHSTRVRQYERNEASSSREHYIGFDHYEEHEGDVNSERHEPHCSKERHYDGVEPRRTYYWDDDGEQHYDEDELQHSVNDITEEGGREKNPASS